LRTSVYVFLFLATSLIFLSLSTEPITKLILGKKLFFDPILSADSTLSCASCHKPSLAFADSVDVSLGIGGRKGTRNAPSVMNMAARGVFFYDGRAETLRDQVHFPIEDPMEMAADFSIVLTRLSKNQTYVDAFERLYSERPNINNVSDAIATFEESLETSDTEFDSWMNDKPNTMSDEAIRGRTLFMSTRAKCFDCHFSPDFTGDEFKNIGLYDEKKYKDKGRYLTTKNKDDLGKFKVPGLRNVSVTAPYMHDGSFKTLDQVIDYYSNPYDFIEKPINIDTSLLKPINFTNVEKAELKAFLLSLTDRQFVKK
jgi:cytochrome c peroxidase